MQGAAAITNARYPYAASLASSKSRRNVVQDRPPPQVPSAFAGLDLRVPLQQRLGAGVQGAGGHARRIEDNSLRPGNPIASRLWQAGLFHRPRRLRPFHRRNATPHVIDSARNHATSRTSRRGAEYPSAPHAATRDAHMDCPQYSNQAPIDMTWRSKYR
jgi:hypothetical protein